MSEFFASLLSFRPRLSRKPHATRGSRRGAHRRWPLLERLEQRCLLARLTENGMTLNITLDNADESLGITSAGTSYTLTTGNTFVNDGITSGRITGFGTGSATVTSDGLGAYDTIQ